MFKILKKAIALVMITSFMFLVPGHMAAADEAVAVPNKLVVFKIGDFNYYEQDLNTGATKKVKMDTYAQIMPPGRTFVPVRYLANALGVNDESIVWDNASRKATLKGGRVLELFIGRKEVVINGKAQGIDAAPAIVPPGRTMLPARYVAEGLGFKVEWDEAKKLVIAYPEGSAKPDMSKVLELIEPKGEPNAPVIPEFKSIDKYRTITDRQEAYMAHKALVDTIVNNRQTGEFSFIAPILPKGFKWSITLYYNTKPTIMHSTSLLEWHEYIIPGKKYTFNIPPEKSKGEALMIFDIVPETPPWNGEWRSIYDINTGKHEFFSFVTGK